MKKFLEFSYNKSILGRKSLFLIIISLLFFSCSNIENPIALQPANQQVQEVVQDEDVSTGDLTSSNDDKTSTDEVGLSGYIPDVLPEVETEISSFSLTATEIALSTQSMEELLANPKVYLLENNDKPEDWYYYNAMKNDKDNPNRAKVYEAYLKLILAGAAIKGDEYPHKIEIPDYSYSYMSEDDLDKANWAFRYDHPEFFYVFWKYSDKRYWKSGDNIVYEGGSGGRLVTNNGKVYLVFDGVYESIEALQADEAAVLAGAQEKLDSFIAEFGNPEASATRTAEETKTMFNNLASFFHRKVYYITWYNHKGRQTAYGSFTNSGGVCEGLSLAFQYFVLLSKIDVETLVVVGRNDVHAWNCYWYPEDSKTRCLDMTNYYDIGPLAEGPGQMGHSGTFEGFSHISEAYIGSTRYTSFPRW